MNEKEHKSNADTYNRLILDVACTVCILQSVKGFLSINISRTYAGWKRKKKLCKKKFINITGSLGCNLTQIGEGTKTHSTTF